MQPISRRKMSRRMGVQSRVAMRSGSVLVVLVLLAFVPGCARRHHRNAAKNVPPAPHQGAGSASRTLPSPPPAIAPGYTEEGIASWYGIPFHGRAAADGEIYDMETLVAAHRTLPFNTWLRVTNLTNDKSVNVRVIDRGPFVNGRILDLSKAAARDIGLLGPGIGKIRLEVISAPPDRPTNDFYAVQIGAFAIRANAEQARQRLASRFGSAFIALKQGRTPLWRVLVGKEASIDGARQIASLLRDENKNVFVVRLDEGITLENASGTEQRSSTPLAPAPPSASSTRR